MNKKYYPMFIDSSDKRALVIGGGEIAMRRVNTLLNFSFEIEVITREVKQEIKELAEEGKIKLKMREFEANDIEGAFMVMACTNNHELNLEIGESCKAVGIPVSICSCGDESSMWFPAVAVSDELTMGLVGEGSDHHVTRKAAKRLREIVKGKAY